MNKLGHFVVALAFAGIALLSGSAIAQVPQLINYQGRVAVGGVNFNGTGQFKFALVDGAGTTTFWSNDGTSSGAGQPSAAVAINVTNGLYSVLLGNSALPGMTGIPASVFSNADVRLRVWFDDGVHGFQLLTPDERIAAVGYAMKAAFASTVSDGAITAEKIANGAVAASLNNSGQSAVASGGLIMSLTENPALASAGYVKIGTASLDGFTTFAWQAPPAPVSGSPPPPRQFHTAVWTGTEMIVWGGSSSGVGTGALNDGGRYNPATNVWTPVSSVNAPSARMIHTALWTGSEMIIWGGEGPSGAVNDGGRYNPATDTWTTIATAGAPSPRARHSAVWTGPKMIVWGGSSGAGSLNDGGRYDLASDTWEPITTANAPSARNRHTAVWTGTEMVVWGGVDAPVYFGDGKRYDPVNDVWSDITSVGAPSPRSHHTAVWTGGRMIVWGGLDNNVMGDGARYNPADDSWAPMSGNSAPAARFKHTAVWTGSEMIVWGGFGGASLNSGSFRNDGARYNPGANAWSVLSSGGAPGARENHTGVWAVNRMIVWGGYFSNGAEVHLNDMGFLAPAAQTMHLYQRP